MSLFASTTIRALTAKDWKDFSSVRLEALKSYPQFFGSSYAEEAACTDLDWQNRLDQTGHCFFGLFLLGELIGITGVMPSSKHPEGDTGLMIASYIKPEYQGKGLSKKLYEARLAFALSNNQWKRLIIGHREGNEASRKANQKWGFQYIGTTPRNWPDGTVADEHLYELQLEHLRRNNAALDGMQPN